MNVAGLHESGWGLSSANTLSGHAPPCSCHFLMIDMVAPRQVLQSNLARGTGAPPLQENATLEDPTVGLCLESSGGPRVLGVFSWARYPCMIDMLAPRQVLQGHFAHGAGEPRSQEPPPPPRTTIEAQALQGPMGRRFRVSKVPL